MEVVSASHRKSFCQRGYRPSEPHVLKAAEVAVELYHQMIEKVCDFVVPLVCSLAQFTHKMSDSLTQLSIIRKISTFANRNKREDLFGRERIVALQQLALTWLSDQPGNHPLGF